MKQIIYVLRLPFVVYQKFKICRNVDVSFGCQFCESISIFFCVSNLISLSSQVNKYYR